LRVQIDRSGFFEIVSIGILIVVLTNFSGLLNSVPRAYATSGCNSKFQSIDSGAPSTGYYYVVVESTDIKYGVQGTIAPGSWNYDGDTSGHMALWVDIPLSGGWVQAGVQAGKFIGYSYSSTRYPYVEYQTSYSGYGVIVATGYPIPGGDNDIGTVYAQSMNGVNYVDYLGLYSPYYGATPVWTTVIVGSAASGNPWSGSETYYTAQPPIGENCDLYANWSTNLVETSQVTTSPSWNSWPSGLGQSGPIYVDKPPYQVSVQSATAYEEYLTS
jgi:hypothetical protein